MGNKNKILVHIDKGPMQNGSFVLNEDEFNAFEAICDHYTFDQEGHDVSVSPSDINILSEDGEEIDVFETLFPDGVGFPFKTVFLDPSHVEDDAIACAKSNMNAFDAISSCHWFNNEVFRNHFLRVFNEYRKF